MSNSSLKVFDPTALKPRESLSGRIHQCDLCGKRGRWNADWSFYGSRADEDAGIVLKICGCRLPSDVKAASLLASKRKQRGLLARPSRDY